MKTRSPAEPARLRFLLITPHFAPDTAPTGHVFTKIVEELALRGHEIEVITSLPWYTDHRVEPGWEGRSIRKEDTPWGLVKRIHPFPVADKTSIPRRALAFGAFTALGTGAGIAGPHVDCVIAVSPPLTLGVAGWLLARSRKARFIFNLQDVFPDIAVELGAFSDSRVIRAAHALERFCYSRADAITVLSDGIKGQIGTRTDENKIKVIPNFTDPETIKPGRKDNRYRRENGLDGKFVVMYAGNIGLSQPLETMIQSAAALTDFEEIMFVVNGSGARRPELERAAAGLPNVRFVDSQPMDRLGDVLRAADVHLVLLQRGLGHLSVPSKIYSILSAGRPVIAGVDPSSEVARILETSGAGHIIGPHDPEALAKEIVGLHGQPSAVASMGRAGRHWVTRQPTAADVAEAYEALARGNEHSFADVD